MRTKPLIYIAGPYTKPDPIVNTRLAIQVGDGVERLGALPFIPHLSLVQHFQRPRTYEEWIEYGLAWVECCDAVVSIPGDSDGRAREEQRAYELDIPIFRSHRQRGKQDALNLGRETFDLVFPDKLYEWIKDWKPPKLCSEEFSRKKYDGYCLDVMRACTVAICRGCKASWPTRELPLFGWIHDIPEEERGEHCRHCNDPIQREFDDGRRYIFCEAGTILNMMKEKENDAK
jgi:hypothetical protein